MGRPEKRKAFRVNEQKKMAPLVTRTPGTHYDENTSREDVRELSHKGKKKKGLP